MDIGREEMLEAELQRAPSSCTPLRGDLVQGAQAGAEARLAPDALRAPEAHVAPHRERGPEVQEVADLERQSVAPATNTTPRQRVRNWLQRV